MAISREGYLDRPVRFSYLTTAIQHEDVRNCYLALHELAQNLGRAVQLGQHRRLIETFTDTLNHETLESIATASIEDRELCAAFSIYFTTVEQAYAWPRDDTMSTPPVLHDHKLVIQMLYHESLTKLLFQNLLNNEASEKECNKVGCVALKLSTVMIAEAAECRQNKTTLDQDKQGMVNLLYRTCTQDWFIQGDYRNTESHKQFGCLHEVIRTTGTQRSVQEIFQQSAMGHLQLLPTRLQHIASADSSLTSMLQTLQWSVTLAREELFNMTIDEVVWGQTFAKYSKPVGFSTIGAGGADCPMFRMLDAVCGKEGDSNGDTLITELEMRSRHFPPTIRTLINKIATAPSLRAYVKSGEASLSLKNSFKVFQQLMYDLYEMHRKKALRIVLSLRAGQLYTSSGTQNAASPEWYISKTLKKAMDVRFGTDESVRRIPAVASAVPLAIKNDGTVESALIRFDFETPIAVAGGDALSVTLEEPSFGVQARTYSITYTKSSEESQCVANESDDIHFASSVEICCRNAGQVSNFMCSQKTPFSALIALAPAPQFRIKANKTENEHVYFIAQNGACGIFAGWLARRTNLVGAYTLVIGARNVSSLSLLSSLLQAVRRHSYNIRLVFCLSRPDASDFDFFASQGLEAYDGRVPEFLGQSTWQKSAPTYVCGSSDFGIDVAKILDRRHQTLKSDFGPRLLPVKTSALPTLHLQVAAAKSDVGRSGPLLTVSRAQMALHNSPGDIWISLKNIVYDISTLSSFHPGGEKTLMCRAGLSADDMFNSIHQGSFEIQSLLEPMAIGTLPEETDEEKKLNSFLDFTVQTQNDLTNTSRFEQRPTGSAEQLSQAPPAEVVRKSLTQFHSSWTRFVQGYNVDAKFIDTLRSSVDSFEARLIERQQSTYEAHFSDMERCATDLRYIFDAHECAVDKIHHALDQLKTDAVEICEKENNYKEVCENATYAIIRAIDEFAS